MLKLIPALGALALSAILLVPTATQAEETNSVRVSYGDLDLASIVGRQKLQHRIASAAKSVCDTADVRDLAMADAIRECRATAIADAQPAYQAAVEQMLHPSVTVLGATALVVTSH